MEPSNSKHIPLLGISYDPESGHYIFQVPNYAQTIAHYRERYGAIGQKMIEIGEMTCRRQYPHFMNDNGWIHAIPKDDIIPHTTDTSTFECPCAPQVDCLNRVVCHHAMDGRGEYTLNNPAWEVIGGQ